MAIKCIYTLIADFFVHRNIGHFHGTKANHGTDFEPEYIALYVQVGKAYGGLLFYHLRLTYGEDDI
ncbi:hypothetical protein [Neobacillus niacini]|uniref:hypothetical protein n=1 Tax=Neobacillus niacini TaxID=86668 RepID=UPI002040A09D|nr:hypothetical protein [Neobacillus niacini]MCM3693596.1 hypothetical protein [Neobacillus niacini]